MEGLSPAALRERLVGYAVERIEAFLGRFVPPDSRWPGFFAGYRVGPNDVAEIAWTASHLRRCGLRKIGRWEIEELISRLLVQVDGAAMETFGSYRAAEALLAFGAFKDNPITASWTAAQRDNLADAVDSSHIYNQWNKPLGGRPNNYWGVLARCEYARQRLGLLEDDAMLREAVGKSEALLFKSEGGFFDDRDDGRYDIYSADMHLFLEPLWPFFDAVKLRRNLAGHARLLETIAMENGAFVAYGRSIGALSVCMTMEAGAAALKLGLASNPRRVTGLIENAFEAFKGWMRDDLIDAHRYRMTFGYRGPHRLIQMTLDCVGKLAYAALELGEAKPIADAPADGGPVELFPQTDTLFEYDARGAGVWMYRNDHLAFQMPLVGGASADYVAVPHCPHLFENPVDSSMVCGVPRLAAGGQEFTSAGIPAAVRKFAGGIELTYEGFARSVGKGEQTLLPGRRVVRFEVDRSVIRAQEHWTFDALPEAITFDVPEAAAPLELRIETQAVHHQATIDVKGIPSWRSFWGEISRVHQVSFAPADEIRFAWTLRRVPRVRHFPGEHDYNRSLYDVVPSGHIVEQPMGQGRPASEMNVAFIAGGCDVVHLGWPEHLFGSGGASPADLELFDRAYIRFLDELSRAPVKVIWTMHNRRPHYMESSRGQRLYRAMAQVADGVIHHSRWGMQLMRSILPYKPTAVHVVAPHGHFGQKMPARALRADLEAEYKLPAAPIRVGVLGRPQKEKQVDLIIRAFLAAGRQDMQLIVTAYPDLDDFPRDPRVILLPRDRNLKRHTIADHNHLCDALVSAHTGDTYLTSGIIADAIGVGIPMICPRWEFFVETFGSSAVYHDNTEAGLTEVFRGITAARIESLKLEVAAMRPAYDWSVAARTLLELIDSIGLPTPTRAPHG